MNEIHLIPTAGLCNRMRAIASAVYIAKYLDLPLLILWNKYKGLNAMFSDLFEPINIKSISLEETNKWKYSINFKRDYLLRKILLLNYKQILYNINVWEGDKVFNKIKTCNGKLLFISCSQMSKMYALNKLFVPTYDIKKILDKITNNFTPNTIGIHVRRTDNTMSIKGSPLEGFIKIIDNEIINNNNVSFYLASDDEQVKEFIKNKYGDRIFSYSMELTRDSLDGMKMAVAELFALSRTSKIIGSYYSSYSQIAAELGNIAIEYVRNK